MFRTRGRTRWKLFSILMLPSLAASAALLVAVAQGALAASFLISNQKFKVTADRIEVTGAIQYGAFDKRYDGKVVPVTVAGAAHSTSYGVCQSTVQRIPLIGKVTVRVTAERVTSQDSYSDVIQAHQGTVTTKNSRTGIAVGVATKGPGVRPGDNVSPTSAAQESDSSVVTDSRSIVVATSARVTKTIGSSTRIYKGVNECF
ncbi:DUF6230 family protein [Streptomyces xantholiticus]|uniref:DUF6230 family protein n=1 Tax=Streptomyces xantholiticus TaxID=68285 RepID=UPI00167BC339|nr:DUF6230 family protein [Streptomyces xantholiticus]GGW62708.1 cholesterol esterase [Streptomyces xantholiticus]